MPDDIKFARERWGTVSTGCHPSLYLDKLVGAAPVKTERQGTLLDEVLKRMGTGQGEFIAHSNRRRAVLEALGATSWTRTTAAPLSLHLSRANTFEHAGICLHRTYGFAYIPGSGLKGMARAWAETRWLPQQQDQTAAWRQIEDAFGWGDTKNRREQIADQTHPAAKRTRTNREDDREREIVDTDWRGGVVFHDAWPTAWPVIEKDILACHHNDYYTAKEGQVPAPGDWESPNLVNFLAVKSGTEFQFALGKAHAGVSDDLLTLAKTFLDGALTDLGAGAKTNAGYGAFKLLDGQARTLPGTRKRIEVELELVTPAFLGGADKHARALRGATIRGLLRYWWRALHGHLDAGTLRAKETDLFGSSKLGGKVAVRIWTLRQSIWQARSAVGVGGDPRAYIGYGPIMYDNRRGENVTQFTALNAGSKYLLVLDCQTESAAGEAEAALAALIAFGGIGSRSRRGWGGLQLTKVSGDSQRLRPLVAIPRVQTVRDIGVSLWESFVSADCRRGSGNLNHTAWGADSRIVASSREFLDWNAALNDFGGKMKKFRDHLGARRNQNTRGPDYAIGRRALESHGGQLPSRVPYRSAFGLPFSQFYSSLGKRTAHFDPVVHDQGPNRVLELRRASPLFIKVGRLTNGSYYWIATYLPAKFLPDGAVIRVSEKGGGMDWKAKYEASQSPRHDGRIPGAPWQASVCQSFLEFLVTGQLPAPPDETDNPGGNPAGHPPAPRPGGGGRHANQPGRPATNPHVGDRLDFSAVRPSDRQPAPNQPSDTPRRGQQPPHRRPR